MNSSSFFRLHLLGRPSIRAEGGDSLKGVTVQRRRVAVLALLALSQDRGVSRDKILGYLWPDSDAEHARNLLNVAVYALRKALGEEAIISDPEGLRLNNAVVGSDVVDFEVALGRGHRADAVKLYGGPFLDGFFIAEAPEFERWVERERDRLGRMYCKELENLADQSEHARDFDRAAEWWKSRAAYDPYDSRVALRLMQALDASGNKAAALQHAQTHERLLRQDFGVEPSADLTTAVETLLIRPDKELPTLLVRPEPRRHAVSIENGALPPVATTAAVAFPRRDIDEKRDIGLPHHRRLATTAIIVGSIVVTIAMTGWWILSSGKNDNASVSTTAVTESTRSSIAVLPFTNMSPDPNEEYFGDGLTDELIGTLSHVRALRVASRTSSFAFKGQKRDIRYIGRLLNVGTVLEGSVRKVGQRVRVTAQLIKSSDGFHLWSETYDREGTDVLAIQTDLALRIAKALEAELTPEERRRIARPPTKSMEAHTLYMQAGYFASQRRRGSLAKAVEYYKRAIAADSQYAAAYSGLASVYPPLGVFGFIAPSEGRARMREPAMKAVTLDSGLAKAHTSLGGYMYAYEWNWNAAEREFKKAIELDPSEAHGWYSVLLLSRHRYDEAIREARKGAELSPLSSISYSQFGYTLVLSRRADLALAALRTAIELDSGLANGHLNIAIAYEALGKRDEALREYEKAAALVPGKVMETAYFGRALVLAGREREGRKILDSLKADAAKTQIYTPQVALLFDALGETDAAVAWLESSAKQRHPAFPHGLAEPAFASLKRDSRVRDILQRHGLPL